MSHVFRNFPVYERHYIANITAKSLNFWLIKMVKEQSLILRNSKFTACLIFSCVGAARKVCPDWLQKIITCHSFNCFSIVWG